MKSIKIMGQKIKIIRVKDMKNFGEFDGDKGEIHIKKGLQPEQELDTILHECVHAVLFYSGQSFVIDNEELEEGIVRAIEYNYLPIVKEVLKREYTKQIKKD